VELCPATGKPPNQKVKQPRILVAGIGNIFLGDDGFGVEVVRRLSAKTFSDDVRIRDFGIRGYDLAYALLDSYELVILVDAAPRGEAPGTVSVIEPELNETPETGAPVMVDAHTMNVMNVFRLARTLGPVPSRILLVACEPADLGGEDGRMGLSEPIEGAIEPAVQVIERLVANMLHGEGS
jgi:hydrogenase maturation protease